MLRFPTPSALFALALTAALCWGATADARPGGHRGAPDCADLSDDEKAVASLKKQIAAEELVAALELSDDQKNQLAGLVSEALSIRDERKDAHAERAREARPLLEDYLADTQSDGSPSDGTVKAFQAFHEERRSEWADRKGQHRDMRERFQAILDDDQLEALQSFRPMAALRPDEGHGKGEADERSVRGKRGERKARATREQRGHRDKAEKGDRRSHPHARHKLVRLIVSDEMLDVLRR